MSTFAKVAVAAVAVIAVGAVGIFALQPRNVPSVGAAPTASPSPSPFPSSSPAAAASMAPPLSETFTSPTNGISIAYPAGWTTRAATEPWTTGWPDFHQPTGDVMYDPTLQDHLFIVVASQPAGRHGRRPVGGRHPRRGRLRPSCAGHDRRRHGPHRGELRRRRGRPSTAAATSSCSTRPGTSMARRRVRPGLVRAAPGDDRPPPGGRREPGAVDPDLTDDPS